MASAIRRFIPTRVPFGVLCIALTGTAMLGLGAGEAPPDTYSNDFSKCAVGKTPADFMVLDGTFAVREVEGNKCLEMATDPIGSFGALFGPEGLSTMDVAGRVWGDAQGHRFPELGIGAADVGGPKLILLPARKALQLQRGDETLASVPFNWTPGRWTWLRLRIEPRDKATWSIQGKAWPDGQKEPQDWTIHSETTEAPATGKASIWANDYSEQPVRFDDLTVKPVK